MTETTTTAATAVSFVAHSGMASGDTSARVLCQKSRLRYSANIRLMTALPPATRFCQPQASDELNDRPGLRADIAVHAKRYDTRGP